MKMTEAEFQRIYRYVKLHYGIDMSKKKEIMTGRLENYVVVHGYASYDAFMNALETDPTGHMEKRLIGMLTTNHTFFMRESEHFDYLKQEVLPWIRQREQRSKDVFDDGVIKVGDIEIHTGSFEVFKNSKPIQFSTREFQLLQYLMENAGKVLTREQIFSHVWDTEFGDIGTVAVNIKSIRDKLDPNNEYIKTVWGVGYKFVKTH